MSEQADVLFKLIVIGDTGTGKSCLLHRFVEGKYKNSSTQTVGVEFGSRIITMGGKRVKLQIWDTAGQERFRAVTRSYYRGAAGAIIVYDISNRDSFSHVQQWLNDAQQLAGEHICMMVVGNKADLQGEREVTFLEASRVAQEAEVLFLETSALTGEGVEDIFMRVARGIHARMDNGLLDPTRASSGIQSSAAPATGSVSLVNATPDDATQKSACGC